MIVKPTSSHHEIRPLEIQILCGDSGGQIGCSVQVIHGDWAVEFKQSLEAVERKTNLWKTVLNTKNSIRFIKSLSQRCTSRAAATCLPGIVGKVHRNHAPGDHHVLEVV
jgi:hypothetical protein